MIHARSDYNDRIQDSAGLIPDDEPVILIRGQDAAAFGAVTAWIAHACAVGADPALIDAVRAHRQRIVAWQAANGAKVPDAPPEVLS